MECLPAARDRRRHGEPRSHCSRHGSRAPVDRARAAPRNAAAPARSPARWWRSARFHSHRAGVPHVAAVEPAGYWRRAAAGEVFYTVADDHKRCPVGAHTHNVTLSPEEKQELMGLVQTMVGLSYLKMEGVPRIPRRKTPLEVAVYAPLDRAPVAPDVVLVRGNARQLMLLAEARNRRA